MASVVAVILAPQSDAERRQVLEGRAVHRLNQRGMCVDRVLFDPRPGDLRVAMAALGSRNVALAWGHESLPDWATASRAYVSDLDIDMLYVFEVSDAAGVRLRTRQEQSQEVSFRVIANGFFLSTVVPYGMRLLSAREDVSHLRMTCVRERALLRPGDPNEIEVVRLIYELFAREDKGRTEIQNVLNAERIPAPNKRPAWKPQDVDQILSDPVYVGASRLGRVVVFGVQPPLVDPALYFLAQAKLLENRGPAVAVHRHWFSRIPICQKVSKGSTSDSRQSRALGHRRINARGARP